MLPKSRNWNLLKKSVSLVKTLKASTEKTVAPRAVLMASGPPNVTLLNNFGLIKILKFGLYRPQICILNCFLGMTPPGGGILARTIKYQRCLLWFGTMLVLWKFHRNVPFLTYWTKGPPAILEKVTLWLAPQVKRLT